jgi:hypothetical protein
MCQTETKRKGDEVSTDPAIHPLVKWEAPKQEYVKVNIDAVFQEESRSGPGALSYIQIKELFLQAQLVRIEHVKSAILHYMLRQLHVRQRFMVHHVWGFTELWLSLIHLHSSLR